MSFLINPYRYASESGGGGGCTTPAAVYTGLAITQTTTSGCYRKPILTATSVSHSLADDTNLRFWVNCRLANTSTTFGAPACSSGSDLVAGKLFTYSQLQSGIDLLASDSTNAAAQDTSDDIAVGWDIGVTACDISDCATSICADALAQTLSATESFPYNGPSVYDSMSPVYPAFNTGTVFGGIRTGSGSTDYETYVSCTVMDYPSSSYSMGGGTYGSGEYKLHVQYDNTCDSYFCSSPTWIDADETDVTLGAGTGGMMMMGTATVHTVIAEEADCWDVTYIAIRARIEAVGSCGTSVMGDWSATGTITNYTASCP
jgi:hypothetical protein